MSINTILFLSYEGKVQVQVKVEQEGERKGGVKVQVEQEGGRGGGRASGIGGEEESEGEELEEHEDQGAWLHC